MNNQKIIFAVVAIVAAVGIAVSAVASNLAYAAISSQTTDTGCTNVCV